MMLMKLQKNSTNPEEGEKGKVRKTVGFLFPKKFVLNQFNRNAGDLRNTVVGLRKRESLPGGFFGCCSRYPDSPGLKIWR